MRRILLATVLCLAALGAPAVAVEPAAATTQASEESVDRLLKAMDMEHMMAGTMTQMSAAQQSMLTETFGNDLSEDDKARMQEAIAETNVIIQKAMAWPALEPIVRKVYMQIFTAREIDAMTTFYDSPEGQSILKKSPQAAVLTMQELQPVMAAAMQEVKAALEAKAKPKQ